MSRLATYDDIKPPLKSKSDMKLEEERVEKQIQDKYDAELDRLTSIIDKAIDLEEVNKGQGLAYIEKTLTEGKTNELK